MTLAQTVFAFGLLCLSTPAVLAAGLWRGREPGDALEWQRRFGSNRDRLLAIAALGFLCILASSFLP